MPPLPKKSKKRKRNWTIEPQDDGSNTIQLSHKKKKKPLSKSTTTNSSILSGMTLAISTLLENSADTSSAESYQKVAELVRSNGARVSGQVHQKVHAVLCTLAALQKSTQRVRKAQKKNVPLVDLKWLYECIQREKKLPWDSFLLKYPTKNDHAQNEVDETKTPEINDTIPDSGWTEAVDVGCCCVCHENGGEADCEWCQDCAATKTKDGKAKSFKPDNSNQSEEEEEISNSGWTEPVDVGCCCVCHENGTAEDCEWCKDCSFSKHASKSSAGKESGKPHSNEVEEQLPDAGWTEPLDVGCCCVCHENGTAKDCDWCKGCK